MGRDTKIEWSDHTFNSWIGCTKISAGCDNCYAEVDTFARIERARGNELWGKDANRHITSKSYWRDPIGWNRTAEENGTRARVFCASMADVFEDHPAVIEARHRLWELIKQTPALDWLILSKRPHNFARLLPSDWGNGYPNVWLGVSAEDQAAADRRVPLLIDIPARIHFVSAEPLLASVSLDPWLDRLDWVIIGGESGSGSRWMDPQWANNLISECRDHGAACFFKQKGERLARQWGCRDQKGGNIEEFPPAFKVREFPRRAA